MTIPSLAVDHSRAAAGRRRDRPALLALRERRRRHTDGGGGGRDCGDSEYRGGGLHDSIVGDHGGAAAGPQLLMSSRRGSGERENLVL